MKQTLITSQTPCAASCDSASPIDTYFTLKEFVVLLDMHQVSGPLAPYETSYLGMYLEHIGWDSTLSPSVNVPRISPLAQKLEVLSAKQTGVLTKMLKRVSSGMLASIGKDLAELNIRLARSARSSSTPAIRCS